MKKESSNLNPLDRFGELMVHGLRDRALEQNEMLLNGQLRGKAVQNLQAQVAELSPEQKSLLRNVVIDLLDTALHDLLFAFQDAHDRGLEVEIIVDGNNVAELSGMLHGEPLGPEGWINRFSRYPRAEN